MPENKERKIIKYGEEPEEPEVNETPEEPEEAAEPAASEEPADSGAPADVVVPVPDYFAEHEDPAAVEPAARLSSEELSGRIDARRSNRKRKQLRKKRLTILIMVLAFAMLATMCGKDIVRLKAENVALKRQQAELKKERDELKAELENTSEQEYIRDQARRQLRLLNPGELLFVWDEK